jgi:PAS domain S-box-containing protein
LLVLAGLWQYFAFPLIKLLKASNRNMHNLTDALPTLIAIAQEFRPNHGTSLRDAINRIEDGVAFSNQRNRAICSYFDIALFETDAAGNYTFVSKDWCTMTGLSPEQAMGDGWINAVRADDRDKVMTAWERSVADKREFALDYEIYTPMGYGETRKISNRAFPSRRGSGSLEHVVGIVGIIRVAPNRVDPAK